MLPLYACCCVRVGPLLLTEELRGDREPGGPALADGAPSPAGSAGRQIRAAPALPAGWARRFQREGQTSVERNIEWFLGVHFADNLA